MIKRLTLLTLVLLTTSGILVACSSSSNSEDTDTTGGTNTAGDTSTAGDNNTAGGTSTAGDANTAGETNTTDGTNAGGQNDLVCTPSPRLQTNNPRPLLGNIFRQETATDERFHQLWNQVTPENAGKWNSVENQRDQMQWDTLDNAINFATDFNYPFKLHTLIAGGNEPTWMASLSKEEQLLELTQWFDLLAARYPELAHIDVVSEPISAPPNFIDALGGTGESGYDWVISAFELARQKFPASELILNDYKVSDEDQTSEAFLSLAETLKTRGLVDAIGIEGHFLENTNPDTISSKLDALTTLGLPVYLSDLDINVADEAGQLETMRTLFPLFYELSSMNGITFWGYRENQLWRTDAFLIDQQQTDRAALDWLECYTGLTP